MCAVHLMLEPWSMRGGPTHTCRAYIGLLERADVVGSVSAHEREVATVLHHGAGQGSGRGGR